jgi:nucleoid-associated protein YgaU
MSESHDPVKDALKHLFGMDKKKEDTNQNQEAQPVESAPSAEPAQPTESPAPVEQAAAPVEQAAPQTSSPDWSQLINAAANLTSQAAQEVTTPQPSPMVSNPVADNPPPEAPSAASAEEVNPVGESQPAAHEEIPAAPAPVAPNPDVESINGYAVGFAFLRYYKAHPEIGLPVDEQHGNVGGYQMFEHAILHWDGSNVQVENRGSQGGGQRTYTVVSGDNLTAIAQQFYGDGSQWHRIYDANRDKISDPNLIYPGQELVIP